MRTFIAAVFAWLLGMSIIGIFGYKIISDSEAAPSLIGLVNTFEGTAPAYPDQVQCQEYRRMGGKNVFPLGAPKLQDTAFIRAQLTTRFFYAAPDWTLCPADNPACEWATNKVPVIEVQASSAYNGIQIGMNAVFQRCYTNREIQSFDVINDWRPVEEGTLSNAKLHFNIGVFGPFSLAAWKPGVTLYDSFGAEIPPAGTIDVQPVFPADYPVVWGTDPITLATTPIKPVVIAPYWTNLSPGQYTIESDPVCFGVAAGCTRDYRIKVGAIK